MQLQEFKPENELENAIADTRKGVRPVADLIRIIARSNLFISSKGEVQSDFSGFDPLLFEKDGHPFVAVFSSPVAAEAAQPHGGVRPANERAGVFPEDAGKLRRYSQPRLCLAAHYPTNRRFRVQEGPEGRLEKRPALHESGSTEGNSNKSRCFV